MQGNTSVFVGASRRPAGLHPRESACEGMSMLRYRHWRRLRVLAAVWIIALCSPIGLAKETYMLVGDAIIPMPQVAGLGQLSATGTTQMSFSVSPPGQGDAGRHRVTVEVVGLRPLLQAPGSARLIKLDVLYLGGQWRVLVDQLDVVQPPQLLVSAYAPPPMVRNEPITFRATMFTDGSVSAGLNESTVPYSIIGPYPSPLHGRGSVE